MVTGRLFHKVAAAFLKHRLTYVTPRVVGMTKNAPDSDHRDLVSLINYLRLPVTGKHKL